MWEQVFEFLSFSDLNVRYVTLGVFLIGVSTAIVGCFTFLKKKALVGDAIAHAALPGVCLGFMLFESKNPLILLGGAFVTGWISLIVIDLITARTKIKADTSIGLVLSIFFGFGIMLLTTIQHSGNAAQSGLDKFLFGKAASILPEDVYLLAVISTILLGTIILFFKQFAMVAFDPGYAKSIGLPVGLLEVILSTLTVLAVATGIQAVGVVLMAALLITPAVAARYWTDRLGLMVLLAAIFGGISGIMGAMVSFLAPAMPTGPWIVVIVSLFAFASILFAPNKGYFARRLKLVRHKNKVLHENILKAFYHLAEADASFYQARTKQEIMRRRPMQEKLLKKGLQALLRKDLIQNERGDYWRLTSQGKEIGQRIVRIHRLWELYLQRFLKMAPDHVHPDADAMEHIITPEMEALLVDELGRPQRDPHDKDIPYTQ